MISCHSRYIYGTWTNKEVGEESHSGEREGNFPGGGR